MKHIFIINPISGKKESQKRTTEITGICKKYDLDYELIYTEYPGHATEIARNKSDVDTCIYSVGGDGTVLEVVNGITKDAQMGIIPSGTGNDFYRTINDTSDSIEEIIEKTVLGKEVKIDLGKSNDEYFLNAASFGMDAQVNYETELLRESWIPKSLVYIVAAIKVIMHPTLTKAKLISENEVREVNALLIAIFNGQYYGGGFHPSPFSKVNDGIFNICYVENIPLYRLPFVLIKYFNGKHVNLKECHFMDVKKIIIDASVPVYVQIDGENKNVSRYEFECLHHQLTLRVPQNIDL